MPKVLDYIPDGYTEQAYIAELPRIHGEVRFTFRPMLTEERAIVFGRKSKELDPRKFEQQCAAELAARINHWSLANGSADQPLPINRETLLKLKPALFQRLVNIVAGLDASDVDPTWPSDQKAEAADAEIEATILGTLPGIALQESKEKNSG